MDTWHRVLAEAPHGTEPRLAAVDGLDAEVLLVRDDGGRLHAIDPACPHTGNPLTMAAVEASSIECRHHCYVYDLLSGACVTPGGPLAGTLVVHDIREGEDGLELRLAPDQTTP